jgi:catechol 2,3-dioxygenase
MPTRITDMVSPVLHHVNLKTTRLDEMIAWYGEVTGLKPNHRAPVGAWLTNDAANHRLAMLAVPGLSDDSDKSSHTGLHHIAFEFPAFADLMANYDRLAQQRIVPAVCLDHGLTISMYYQDPDGNLVELQADAFGDWEKSSEWMRTSPDFAANPIGVFFDPAAVLAAWSAGTPFQELHSAIMASQFLPDPIPPIAGLPAPEPR